MIRSMVGLGGGPGCGLIQNAEEIVATVQDRTDGVAPADDQRRIPSLHFGHRVGLWRAGHGTHDRTGRRPILPARRLPQGLTYATVHKQRQNDRVVGVDAG